MKKVTDAIIDKVLDELDTLPDDFDKVTASLKKEQPTVFAYLFSEDLELLTDDEQDYLLYLTLVIWVSIKKVQPELLHVTETQLSDAEEANWERLEHIKSTDFQERTDIFFEDYSQEDLLQFVHDALTDDEDDAITTKEGREPMFVTLKSIIDTLCAA